jgi:oligo-1,6-glucosidase
MTGCVQWDSTDQAGFTTGTPWMRVNEDYKEWNVATQLKTNDSVLAFWKQALKVRKANNILAG